MKRLVLRACTALCLAAAVLVPGTLHAQAKRAITHIAGDKRCMDERPLCSCQLRAAAGDCQVSPIIDSC